MGQSRRLRLRDVRAIYRVIGECRELGADPIAWRRHLLEQLCGLLGARVGVAGEILRFGSRRPEVAGLVHIGFEEDQAKEFHRWLASGGPGADPFLQAFARLPHDRINTRRRPQLLSDAEWYSCASFQESHRWSDVDHGIVSHCPIEICGRREQDMITVRRSVGEPDFSRRERLLIHLLHDELAPLIGSHLAAATEPSAADLTPRLQEVLESLLKGGSEKQIAAELRLSRETVHEYVRHVYQHFGVRSRPELMARWIPPRRSAG